MRRLRCVDYTVGWVCALPVELAAAQLMLDEQHADLERDPTDNHDNLYVLGSINGHNVAIGCLPAGQTGTNSAAVVATQMLATFKQIRFGLMVGIGGGVPSDSADIRLGDVVVSQPHGTFGGVVQYDMGKTTVDGFLRTGSLNSPPQTLLNAVARIRANDWLGKSKLTEHAARLEGTKFQRSRAGLDILFDATYNHKDPRSQTCVSCSADKIVTRESRIDGEEVVVHYGTIASGNQVMKNASERDKASAQLGGVLCFEMEAAGLLNTFPCLVVRGICDYSDTHKNDRWHAYAAGIAAAYAKEVLSVIKPVEVAETQTADDDIRQCSDRSPGRPNHHVYNVRDVAATRHDAERTDSHQNHVRHGQGNSQLSSPAMGSERNELSDEQRSTIKASLNFKQRDARLITLKQAQARTCQWLLKNSKYLDWMHADKITQHRGFFWIKGKPGSGKSIMMKFLFSRAKRNMKDSLVLSFFFNARGETLEKTTSGLYRALLLQLLEKAPQAWEALEEDDQIDATLNLVEHSGWPDEVLRQLFIRCLEKLEGRRVVCYVDALDECPEDDVRAMVSFFEEIGDTDPMAEFRVCFSSRHYPEISIRTGLQLTLEAEAEHTNDIRLYINANLKIGNSPQVEDVRAEILRKASGIFLWVHLVIPVLNKEYDTGRIKALKIRLARIPAGLHDLFVDMLTRDQRNLRSLRVSIEILLHAARPLTPGEFRIAVETFRAGYHNPQRFRDAEIMGTDSLRKLVLDSTKGLAEITKSKEPIVQWIHESVRDFFLKEDGLSKLRSVENSLLFSGHEIFVKLCLIQLNWAFDFGRDKMSKASRSEQTFIRYAVKHVLSHANEAQKQGADQRYFLENFDLRYRLQWSLSYHEDREEGKFYDVHIIYYLAECDADELIRISPRREEHFELKGGPFGLPLLAALFAGHNAAARALMGLPPAQDDESDSMAKPKPRSTFSLKRDKYRKSRHILTYLCEYGDPELLESALFVKQRLPLHITTSELFKYANSESIVDTIASFLSVDIQRDTCFVTVDQRKLAASTPSDNTTSANIKLPYLSALLEEFPHLRGYIPSLWLDDETLLVYAAARGFSEVTKLCTKNAALMFKQKALSAALYGDTNQEGRILILEQLFDAGLANTIYEESLFKIILLPRNESVVTRVLSKTKLNLEATNSEGMTPLLWAIYHGRKAYVKMFLDAGSDPMARVRNNGPTAIMLAVKLSDLSSFRLLLDHPKIRLNARDAYGQTALIWCAKVADDCAVTMIDDLRRAAVSPNLKDKSGRTALMRAVESANLGTVKSILQFPGIEPDFGPARRSTPMRLCIMRYIDSGHNVFLDIARTLLAQGADIKCARKLPTPAELIAQYDISILAPEETFE